MEKKLFVLAVTVGAPVLAMADPEVPADVQTMLDNGGLALAAIVALGITVRNYRLVFKLIGKVFGWVFGKG
jgi:hypothetical protein